MTAEGPPPQLRGPRAWVPGYQSPEVAARAVAQAARYGRWRAAPARHFSTPSDVAPERAAAIISRELSRGAQWLSPVSVAELLNCYGLPLIETRIVADAEQAVSAASELGLPVALKASATGLIHKTDAGGVRLNLDSPAAVRAAAAQMQTSLRAAGHGLDGLIVQPMAPAGVELIVGVVHDHSFGPVLACGAGGTTAELIKDVAVQITPLSDADARDALRSLHTFPLLDGYRGAPRCDLAAIENVLLRVSAMVEAHPEIAELDCNPLIALPDRAIIIDARVRIEPAAPAVPLPSLAA